MEGREGRRGKGRGGRRGRGGGTYSKVLGGDRRPWASECGPMRAVGCEVNQSSRIIVSWLFSYFAHFIGRETSTDGDGQRKWHDSHDSD